MKFFDTFNYLYSVFGQIIEHLFCHHAVFLCWLCSMHPAGMMMNGQPQPGYPPQANQPFSSGAQFVNPGQRPPVPFQQFNPPPPSSSGFPPVSGTVEDNDCRSLSRVCYLFVKSKQCSLVSRVRTIPSKAPNIQ